MCHNILLQYCQMLTLGIPLKTRGNNLELEFNYSTYYKIEKILCEKFSLRTFEILFLIFLQPKVKILKVGRKAIMMNRNEFHCKNSATLLYLWQNDRLLSAGGPCNFNHGHLFLRGPCENPWKAMQYERMHINSCDNLFERYFTFILWFWRIPESYRKCNLCQVLLSLSGTCDFPLVCWKMGQFRHFRQEFLKHRFPKKTRNAYHSRFQADQCDFWKECPQTPWNVGT